MTVILAILVGPGKVFTGPVNVPLPRFNEPPVTATEPVTVLPFTSTIASEMFNGHLAPPSGVGTVVVQLPATGKGDVRNGGGRLTCGRRDDREEDRAYHEGSTSEHGTAAR